MSANYYVNNKEFLQHIIVYQEQVYEARAKGKSEPRIPNTVAVSFMRIAERRATHPWFRQYSFVDEMICDAVEDCVRRIMNFNPEKSSNPFAYFSQIVYYAFLRKMQAEQKQARVKSALERKNNIFGEDCETQDHDTQHYGQGRIYMEDKFDES